MTDPEILAELATIIGRGKRDVRPATQRAVATYLLLPDSTVSAIIHGRRAIPGAARIKALARIARARRAYK